MKTINAYELAERIIAAKTSTLPMEHASVLEECIRIALQDVVFIDASVGDVRPITVLNEDTKAGASATQVGGSHYKDMPIQHALFCQKNNISWCEAAAIKYLCRHKKKNKLEDLKKAMHYVRLAAEYEYGTDI